MPRSPGAKSPKCGIPGLAWASGVLCSALPVGSSCSVYPSQKRMPITRLAFSPISLWHSINACFVGHTTSVFEGRLAWQQASRSSFQGVLSESSPSLLLAVLGSILFPTWPQDMGSPDGTEDRQRRMTPLIYCPCEFVTDISFSWKVCLLFLHGQTRPIFPGPMPPLPHKS